jgi:ribosome hibernation promoting factor
MQLTVTGKQVAIGEALRGHIENSLDAILEKYFGAAIEAHVVVAREAHQMRAETSLRIGRGIVVNAGATAGDFYAAFDACAERIGKQLRRYKRRLRDHHSKGRGGESAGGTAGDVSVDGAINAPEPARAYILAPPADDDDDDGMADRATGNGAAGDEAAPVVIAEMSAEVPLLSVAEAAMRIDLADLPVLLFRSRADGELNLLYRRGDGNIGWIAPQPARSRAGSA